jgi:hypothetical protein
VVGFVRLLLPQHRAWRISRFLADSSNRSGESVAKALTSLDSLGGRTRTVGFSLLPGALAEGEVLFGSSASGTPAFTFSGQVTFFEVIERFDVGGELGFWFQPDVIGGLVVVDCTFSLFDWGRIYGKVGYKSDGYVVGKQYNAGFFAQGGVVLSF